MKEMLLMRSICYDSVLLDQRTEYQLFDDSDDEIGERIRGILEAQIVRWFFQSPHQFAPYLFTEELNIPPGYLCRLEVRVEFTSNYIAIVSTIPCDVGRNLLV